MAGLRVGVGVLAAADPQARGRPVGLRCVVGFLDDRRPAAGRMGWASSAAEHSEEADGRTVVRMEVGAVQEDTSVA